MPIAKEANKILKTMKFTVNRTQKVAILNRISVTLIILSLPSSSAKNSIRYLVEKKSITDTSTNKNIISKILWLSDPMYFQLKSIKRWKSVEPSTGNNLSRLSIKVQI